MPPKKQYVKVKRVSFRDVFLLSRVDLMDGKRFHMDDVVAACASCRRVSKRAHWLEAENACPFCESAESMTFDGKKGLTAGANPPVLYSAPRLNMKKPGKGAWKAILPAAALILLALIFLPRLSRGKAGFFRTEDGGFFYQDQTGKRYTDGDYSIDGQMYHFENGLLAGESVFEIDRVTQITDDNGKLRRGWTVYRHQFVYLGAQGVENERVPATAGEGFYDLEGLGRVYITARNTPGNGWVVYQNRLYHLRDGQGDPMPEMPGEFDALGAYIPDETGFVETDKGVYFVEKSGLVRSGYVVYAGFVYLMDAETCLLTQLREGELPHVHTGFAGALIPDEDGIFACQGGSVVVEARTGSVKTGWLLMDGGIYCAEPSGYLRCGQESKDPKGRFDAQGRFIPAQAGRLEVEGLSCYVCADGTLATGCVKEGDALCLYSASGELRRNEQIGSVGVTDGQGTLHPYAAGMVEIEGDMYCLNQQGAVLTGWQRIGKLYYFDPVTGKRATAGALVNGVAYPMSREGYFTPAVEGVYQLDGESYYVMTDGSLASGWRAVDGKLCYFDEQTGQLREEGIQAEQTGWIQKNAARFYVDADGTAARGWRIIDGRVYCFDLRTGAALIGGQRLDGRVYRFREDGALMPDAPLALTIDGASMRIGVSGQPEGGYLCASGHLYYYDQKTALLSAELPEGTAGWISALGGYLIPEREGLFSAGALTYYLDGSGDVLTGWFVRDGCLYFADPDTGLVPEGGENTALGGSFHSGVFTPDNDGVYAADGREYVFMNGKLVNGWVLLENGVGYVESGVGHVTNVERVIDGESCRFDKNGRYRPGVNRLLIVQGQAIFLLADGTLPTSSGIYMLNEKDAAAVAGVNPQLYLDSADDPYPIGGYLIAVLSGGRMATSAAEVGLSATAFSVRGGILQPVTSGINYVDGLYYLLRADGAYAIGVCLCQHRLYLFNESTGIMVRNAYGFGNNGAFSPQSPGLYTVNGQTYYLLDETGTVGVGLFETGDGKTLYADARGVLVSGLTEISGSRYYFFGAGDGYAMARQQFLFGVKDADGVYDFYADNNGKLVTGWRRINGTLRYFDEYGHMLYDTIQDGRYINIFGEVI